MLGTLGIWVWVLDYSMFGPADILALSRHSVHDVYLGVGTRLLKSIGRSLLDVLPCFMDRHSYMPAM